MNTTTGNDWDEQLQDEFKKPYFLELTKKVEAAYSSNTVYPAKEAVFAALAYCSLADTKVVILGQDPYHGAQQAHGLAFSVQPDVKIPPSLRNIYKELENDLGITPNTSGHLTRWATQGVLLLNTTLTVADGKAGSHHGWGWEQFTDSVIETIHTNKEHVVFMLWGKPAQTKGARIDRTKHLVLEAPHPSPLSAYRGFFGCQHFSAGNAYLQKHNRTPIDW